MQGMQTSGATEYMGARVQWWVGGSIMARACIVGGGKVGRGEDHRHRVFVRACMGAR